MKKRLFFAKNKEQLLNNRSVNMSDCAVINADDFTEYSAGPDHAIPLGADIDKALFEKKYIDLIASLGKEKNNLYWWASALSEKNSFISKLFIRLFMLVSLDGIIKKITASTIAIISSDRALIKQLKFNYRKDFAISSFYKNRGYVCDLNHVFRASLSQLKNALLEYRNLLFVRKELHARKAEIKKKEKYTVLRTFMDHRSYKTGVYSDSYFKNLVSFLPARGKNVLIFAGILSDFKNTLAQVKQDENNLIVPVNFYLKGFDICRCLFLTCFKRPSIKRRVFFYGNDITHLISAELLRDMLPTNFFTSLIQHYCCLRLVESVSVERFIYTFENYAWEKMSISGLRRISSSIKIIGFQHAFISKNSFKYFPGAGESEISPLPDKIVTIGKQTQKIMNRLGNYPDGIFSAGCALRQEYLFRVEPLARSVNRAIFVPLTITVEDTVKVFCFLFESGLGQSPEKIYLRFHPATPVKAVLKELHFSLPDNFIISENPSIYAEMERCSVVLYTWTTVCLEALKMGRPVIYLDVNYPLEMDPLFECNHLRDACREPGDLIEKINKIRNLNDEKFKEESNKAREYLSEYFMPVSEENLSAFIA